jgi:uncharacterized protein YjdB
MRARFVRRLAVAVGLAMFTLACGQSTNTTAPTTVSSLAVTGSTVGVGQTAQLKATAFLSNNSTEDVTDQAFWQSANTSVATVSATTGVVTGVAPGTATITATYQESVTYQTMTGSAQATVTP